MSPDVVVERLFDEFAAAYAGGEHPDVLVFLERAGPARGELARLLDAYLQEAPPVTASPVERALIAARLEHEPALLVFRRDARLPVDVVVDRLRAALGLSRAALAQLERRYHDLEAGLLDAARVAPAVWDGLRAAFGVDVRPLAGVPTPMPAAQGKAAFLRTKERADLAKRLDREPAPAAAAAPAPGGDEPAEVDRLFGVGD